MFTWLAGSKICLALHSWYSSCGVGKKLGDVQMIDCMVNDGLTDPTNRYHMGITAENVAAQCDVSRADQDAFALESHRRATSAQGCGYFDAEIVPISVGVPERSKVLSRRAMKGCGQTPA